MNPANIATPAPRQRLLWAVLAVSLGLTAYLQTQGDDGDLLAARPSQRGGAGATPRAPSPDADAARRPADRSPATQDAPTAGQQAAAAAWLHGMQAWSQRLPQQASDAASGATRRDGGATASAWSPVAPSPAPVIRPPVPTEVVMVPAAPTAPRFPHQWVGRFNEGAVLSGSEATWVVQPGDVIEGQWRIDRIEGQRLSLTYLPLNQSQQILMR